MFYIDPNDFLKLSVKIPVVDVRSPGEFKHGNIPSSFNLPLFNNEERAIIGTIFNTLGQQKAIEKGFEIAHPKKSIFIEDAIKLAVDKKLLVHCWRGGMRSENMAKLFESAGIVCMVLKGGYKAYREKVFEDFENINNLVVIHGPTGSGKTEILHTLHKKGEQVIDLEHYACHRGSVFGDLGLPPQPTTMQFQNDIHACLLNYDPCQRIWLEGESLNIGKVYLPSTLWNCMNRSTVIRLEMGKKIRIRRIIKEYGKFPMGVLIDSIKKLDKRYGGDRTQHVIRLVEKGRLEEAVERLLDYYDKNYKYSFDKYVKGRIHTLKTDSSSAAVNAKSILKKLKISELYA